MVLQFIFMLLMQDLHLSLQISLNVMITWYIFSDSLTYVKSANFSVVTLLILSDVPHFGVNETCETSNKEIKYNAIQVH